MDATGPVLLLVLGICLARLLAERTRLPSPVLLVLLGLAAAALPGELNVELDPEVVLLLVLPPLLYSAALNASLLDFRANARPIALLSFGLVIFTCLAVGLVAHTVVPDLPWAAALALGAIVSPPDAVAAIAIGRRVGLPTRLMTLIEGEGLINDATALVLYSVAIDVAVGGGFSYRETGWLLLLSAVGGAAVGVAVAYVIMLVRRRLDEPLVENVLSLATPFLAFVPAERIHASGVLAVVVCGLVLGHKRTTLLSSQSRLQTAPVWRVVDFLLEGGVFLLIGLQLPEIVRGLDGYESAQLTWWSTAVVLTVLLTRPLWIVAVTHLPQLLSPRLRARDPAPPWQYSLALSWAGMRGVVSLAAAFAIPLEVETRDLLLFLVFVVILSTLVLQGLTFEPLLRVLQLRPDRQGQLLAQAAAQQAAVRAALERLDQVVAERPEDAEVADRLRKLADARANARWERLSELGAPSTETPSATWRRLRGVMLEAERDELLRLRDAGRLPEEAMREMQDQIDLEEAALLR